MSITPKKGSDSSDRFPEFEKAAGAASAAPAEADGSEPEIEAVSAQPEADEPSESPAAVPAKGVGINPWLVGLCIAVPILCLAINLVVVLRLQHRVDYLTTYSVDRVRDLVNANRTIIPAVQAEIERVRRPVIPRSGVEGLGDLYSAGLKKPAEFRQTILDEFKTVDRPSYFAFLERFAIYDPDTHIRENAKAEVNAYIGYLAGELFSSDKQHRMAAASTLGGDFHGNPAVFVSIMSQAAQNPNNDPGIYDSLAVMQRVDLDKLKANADKAKKLIAHAKGMTNVRLHYAANLVEERLNGKALSGNLSEAN